MAKLYEKFVFNFYRRHLDSAIFQIHSPKLQWNLDAQVDEEDLSLLPEMRTDIVIVNKKSDTQLIIDTKFYGETLVSSNHSTIDKIRTGHLYQMYAYINNSNYSKTVKGMLLYPTVTKELNANFSIQGKEIAIRTLNLNAEWEKINNRLLEFAP